MLSSYLVVVNLVQILAHDAVLIPYYMHKIPNTKETTTKRFIVKHLHMLQVKF